MATDEEQGLVRFGVPGQGDGAEAGVAEHVHEVLGVGQGAMTVAVAAAIRVGFGDDEPATRDEHAVHLAEAGLEVLPVVQRVLGPGELEAGIVVREGLGTSDLEAEAVAEAGVDGALTTDLDHHRRRVDAEGAQRVVGGGHQAEGLPERAAAATPDVEDALPVVKDAGLEQRRGEEAVGGILTVLLDVPRGILVAERTLHVAEVAGVVVVFAAVARAVAVAVRLAVLVTMTIGALTHGRRSGPTAFAVCPKS